MARVNIFSISKTKEPWLQHAIEEYSRRLRPILSIEWHLAKNGAQLEQMVRKEKSFIALDPHGKTYTSEEFSTYLSKAFEREGSPLSFLIGGAEGIPPHLLKEASHTLSLSSLTFTHQIARLLLIEQLYRAFEIQKGSRYHK